MPRYDAPSAAVSVYPWLVDVNVLLPGSASVGTWSVTHNANYLTRENSSNVQNDSLSYDLVIPAGTWTLWFLFTKNNDRAIVTFDLDGTALTAFGAASTTIDGYNGSVSYNQEASITGIVIPSTVKRRLTLKAATRNASAVGWYMSPQALRFARTL